MAAGCTMIVYNDVKLFNCLTRRFDQEAVYDDSGTDLLYHRFSIRVVGYCLARDRGLTPTTFIQAISGPGLPAQSAALRHSGVRHALGEQRKSFEMRLGVDKDGNGGQVLLACESAIGVNKAEAVTNIGRFDVNNGPKAKLLSVTNVASDEVLRVEVEFEICKLECGGAPHSRGNDNVGAGRGDKSAVLSNKWTVTDEIDKNLWTTRTYSGRLRLASVNVDPNDFRAWVVPHVQNGMRRDHLIFTVSADGLNLDWNVIDREVLFSAPAPATSWSFSHTELSGDGKMVHGTIDIALQAPRDADRTSLMFLAAGVIDAKLLHPGKVVGGPNDGKNVASITEEFSITDEVNDETATIKGHARVKRAISPDNTWRHILRSDLGKPLSRNTFFTADNPDYDPERSRGNYKDTDPAETEGPLPSTAAFACYLQDPCAEPHSIVQEGQTALPGRYGPSPGQGTPGTPDTPGGIKPDSPPLTVTTVTELPPDKNDLISIDHATAIYTFWRLDSHIIQEGGRIQLPIAGPAAATSQGSPLPSCVIASLFPSLWKRTVRIRGERVGAEPVLPSLRDSVDPSGARMVLLQSRIVPQSADLTPDGQRIYRVAADLTFAFDRQPDFRSLPVGGSPWTSIGYNRTTADAFSDQVA